VSGSLWPHIPLTFRYAPVKLPLAVFFLCTVLSIALSGHIVEGWEGARKFYLFLVPLVVMSTVESREDLRLIVFGMTGMATLSAAWSAVQFARKYQAAQAAGVNFRLSYTAGERITGFMSYWMTLSGEEMIVLLMIASLGIWGVKGHARWALLACAAVIAVSLAAGYTRSMWMALRSGPRTWRGTRTGAG
jgi:hypothetical protein